MLRDDIAHVAELARLNPDPATLDRFGRQCAEILRYVDVLGEVDTTNVEPLYSPVTHDTPFRPDVCAAQCADSAASQVESAALRERHAMLSNAPAADDRFFIVPRIV